jgi:Ca2+-binding EF-hand superfamily protein
MSMSCYSRHIASRYRLPCFGFMLRSCLNLFFVHQQLVAKLKSIFDRFDNKSVGKLTGTQVEQMLVYMNRPIDSAQVQTWILKLKDSDDSIEFPEFVAQYSVRIILYVK